MKDYYELLEVSQNASDEVIARAYKVLAKKYHPDMNPENPKEAEAKFKEITEAYEILSDPTKKKSYDNELNFEKEAKEYKEKKTEEKVEYEEVDNSNDVTSMDMYEEQSIKDSAERIDAILREHENAVEQAYNDAYVNALRSMGVEVTYKKTFKEKVQGFLRLLTFLIIAIVVLFLFFQIPAVKEKVNDFFSNFPIINKAINAIKNAWR